MADLLVEVGPVKSPHYRLEAVRQLGYKPTKGHARRIRRQMTASRAKTLGPAVRGT
jgi:hypothetical protein